MVTTYCIAPNPILAAYVSSYTLRHFDTGGIDFKRPWFACHLTSIVFFFKDKQINLQNPISGIIIKKCNCINVLGLSSEYNGEMTYNGCYLLFEIAFNPIGLNGIFEIPVSEIRNHIMDGIELLGPDIQTLYRLLCNAKDIKEMGQLADIYLLNHLLKKNQVHQSNNLLKIVENIVNSHGRSNLDQIIFQANMSNRNLERLFINKVGVSPKHLNCIVRFNLALSFKKRNAKVNWSAIAAEYGYFDQMHMISEFKHLSGNTPSNLMKILLMTEN
ncbi:MAG TPA: AraC family transcriptional regulator [Gelidibacter sp.]|uniref:helix-turn-helix domain-containing protein n=1 Tax=Gelidibacter sp. TaxID=2018083 RepID=UPI002CC732CC|nr:AraC family transcriptional regulator [Gelidibacter sp.]HXJ98414.1 AraC family transcriptional regulator [Gelidibacter sp.]